MAILNSLMNLGSVTFSALSKVPWDKVFYGAGAIGAVASMFSDPTEDIRNQLERQIAERQRRDEELYRLQLADAQRASALKGEFMNQYGKILSGEMDVSASPMFASQFANLRKAKSHAMRQIEETYPVGGARERALKQLNASFGDAEASMSGSVQKYIFDLASRLNVPYDYKPSSSSSDLELLAGLREGIGFDPGALLKLGEAYGKVFPKEKTVEPLPKIGTPSGPPKILPPRKVTDYDYFA